MSETTGLTPQAIFAAWMAIDPGVQRRVVEESMGKVAYREILALDAVADTAFAAQTKRADDAEARVQRLREVLWRICKAYILEIRDGWGIPIPSEFACDTMPADWDDGTAALAEKGDDE